ncbi:MAG: hypothetical protein H6741_22635 [Alphaproteobacteria bacterium]|nr:hypothetical protein [Alphaproteobacteria bacterium]
MTTMLPLLLLSVGCSLDEHLPQVDVSGTVVVPRAAATRMITDANGNEVEHVDPRYIGPIYLGAYPEIRDDLFDYPHPEMGPVVSEGIPGDTYPYGGGSVGRFDFACFESTVCKVVTGRYADYDDLLEFFRDYVGQPITDEFGAEVVSTEYYRSYCYDLFEYTADYEMDFISGYAEDEDGNLTALTSFTENADGDFEASFDMWQVTYYQGMKLWGWMDSPNERFTFSTCNPDDGQQNNQYTNDFTYGSEFTNLLNFPSLYIHEGDYVISEPYEATAEDADAFRDEDPSPVLRFDFLLEG